MERNKKQISTCHSELASESMSLRGVLTPWQSRRAATGRSMVEMLGVLAIIGVLSIGALAGYRAAITRHKANSILADVSLGLADLKTQDRADTNFGAFNFRTESGYAITGKQSASGYAYVKVENVEEAVCEKLLAFKNTGNYGEIYSDDAGTNALNECTADALTTLVFAERGTVAEPVEESNNRDDEGCTFSYSTVGEDEACCAGVVCGGICCLDGTTTCIDGTDGKKLCAAANECPAETPYNDGSGCSECITNKHCEEKYGDNYYCLYNNHNGCGDTAKGSGTCQKVGVSAGVYMIDAEGNTVTDLDKAAYVIGDYSMNWWTAVNWCKALGKELVASPEVLGCSTSSCTGSTMSTFAKAAETQSVWSLWVWTKKPYDDGSCYVIDVSLGYGGIVGYDGHDIGVAPLCR